jgi:PAS domain S-box-containing protein
MKSVSNTNHSNESHKQAVGYDELPAYQHEPIKTIEEKFQQSQDLISAVLNGSRDLIFTIDRNYAIQEINEQTKTILKAKLNLEWQPGMSVFKILKDNNDAESRKAIYDRVFNGERVPTTELKLNLLDGSVFFGESTYHPIVSAKNEITGIVIFIHDITARKKNERALTESRNRLDLIIQGTNVGIWDINMATKEMYISPKWKSMLGYEDHEIQNNYYAISQLYHPEDVQSRNQEMQAFLEGQGQIYESEHRLLQKDGTYRWVNVRCMAFRDENGKMYRMVGTQSDIQDRKKAETVIRESQARLSSFMNAMPVGVFVVNKNGSTYFANQLAKKVMGQGLMAATFGDTRENVNLYPAYIIGTNTPYPPKERPTAKALNGQASAIDDMEIDVDGKRLPIEVHATPVYNTAGELEYAIVVIQDITERKAAEREMLRLNIELEARFKQIQETQNHLVQTEKMSALGQMVAGIAHELNTPIGYASSNMSLIRERFKAISDLLVKSIAAQEFVFSGELEKALAKMQEVSTTPNGTTAELTETIRRTDRLFAGVAGGFEQMTNLVKSMRNFSRLDEADMKKADINEGVKGCLLMIGHMLKDKDVELTTEYQELPPIDCFPAQLNQVFLNLISNAIQAVEEKSNGRVHVKTTFEDNHIWVRITDNGNGIPKHVQTKIFDPFFTTKPVGKGTGLGLSISYDIIRKHSGQLSFETMEGEGTTFIVKIPAVEFMSQNS